MLHNGGSAFTPASVPFRSAAPWPSACDALSHVRIWHSAWQPRTHTSAATFRHILSSCDILSLCRRATIMATSALGSLGGLAGRPKSENLREKHYQEKYETRFVWLYSLYQHVRKQWSNNLAVQTGCQSVSGPWSCRDKGFDWLQVVVILSVQSIYI